MEPLADSLAKPDKPDPEADPAYYGHDAGVIAMTLSMCSHNMAPACRGAKRRESHRQTLQR